MAKPYRLREVEQEHGNLHDVIPRLADEHGQDKAGDMLGLSGATISTWLRDNGYKQRKRWEREEQQAS